MILYDLNNVNINKKKTDKIKLCGNKSRRAVQHIKRHLSGCLSSNSNSKLQVLNILRYNKNRALVTLSPT